jgi:ABC-type multidrug transport system ATPase subunit
MSEQILKALMQLFAIIARPQSNRHDRRIVVENFLRRQLNSELVSEYLELFDYYYALNQQKSAEDGKFNKRTSSSSVKVLVICTEINEELTQRQKIILLFQLLEFIKADSPSLEEITVQELQFVATVSDTFNIQQSEFELVKNFVLLSFDKSLNSDQVAIIENKRNSSNGSERHVYYEGLEGQLRVLHILSANIYLTRYIGHGEIYINGQLLHQDKIYVLNTGSSIRNTQIKPLYYSDVVGYFHEGINRSKIIFDVKDIEYQFKEGKTGLHAMSFMEESGRLVGIMGASGAGKSTLVNVLNGTLEPSAGEVLINGINIHNNKTKTEGYIGYVSQEDFLIEELTVFENLYYNAKLCFDNYSDEKIEEMVNDLLVNLGLFENKDMKVGSPLNKKISGGQRKRLNIALELIREPSILFLDEPTSGLSSRDSENIMDLLKELAFKGKLIFVVIHQPSSDIFKMFDRLLILDSGGYLIYNGDPIDSIIYFKSRMHYANWNDSECHVCGNVNPEQVFNIVETRVLDENGKITLTRKVSPKEWNDYFKLTSERNEKEIKSVGEMPQVSLNIPNRFKQFLVFAQRDIKAKLSNIQYLIVNFFETPVLAFLLSYIIKYYNITGNKGYTFFGNSNLTVYIFMSVIVAIFVGLSVSAEEIIKDRKILKREEFLNLSRSSYLLSKIGVLLTISAIQALFFVLIANSIIEVKGMYIQYWLVLFSAWAAANLMGLVISDSFTTVVTIYILIPFLVIPQIILSGVIVKYDKINPSISSPSRIPFYGETMVARWAYEALAVYQFTENKYEKIFYSDEKKMSIAEFKKNFWVRNLKNKAEYLQGISFPVTENDDDLQRNLEILRNEIEKENEVNELVKFGKTDFLYPQKLNSQLVESLVAYLDKLNKYYIKVYNFYNDQKDNRIRYLQRTTADKENFIKLKMDYHNENLTEFVTNSSDVDRIVEHKGELFQKIDPIYLDPVSPMIKAHFYAPRKMIFGFFISTFWANIIVIWLMTIGTYFVLYYRLLKKLLDFIEQLVEVFSNNKE